MECVILLLLADQVSTPVTIFGSHLSGERVVDIYNRAGIPSLLYRLASNVVRSTIDWSRITELDLCQLHISVNTDLLKYHREHRQRAISTMCTLYSSYIYPPSNTLTTIDYFFVQSAGSLILCQRFLSHACQISLIGTLTMYWGNILWDHLLIVRPAPPLQPGTRKRDM